MSWINTQDQLPKLELKQGVVLTSKKVLIYREEFYEIEIGWFVQTPSGHKSWRTRNESAIMMYDVDYWQDLPEIPSE
jgi:Protein of unknown function (DUF551)